MIFFRLIKIHKNLKKKFSGKDKTFFIFTKCNTVQNSAKFDKSFRIRIQIRPLRKKKRFGSEQISNQ